jgi:hypothetical protein
MQNRSAVLAFTLMKVICTLIVKSEFIEGEPMDITELLNNHGDRIVNEAVDAMQRAHLKHYEQNTLASPKEHLSLLYDLVKQCVNHKNLLSITSYAEKIARERYHAGFDLQEVQMAINVLEESIWRRIIGEMSPSELAQALGLISTVLGAAKDTLARTYVSLSSKSKSPSLDLKAMFKGSEGF